MKLDRHGIPAYAGMTVGDMNSIEWMDVSAKKARDCARAFF
jgi:hypothetical protein